MSQQRLLPDAELARFVSTTTFDDIPPEGVRAVERAFIDTIGVTIPGVSEPAAMKVRTVFIGNGSGESSILGTDSSASAADAALANATAGHALDYDDVTGGVWHPSVTLVAPTIAIAEREGSTGEEIVTAFAIGFSVEHYAGECILPSHYEAGWHATSTLGTLGAAAAVASLLDLDERRTRHALNCAASMPSGLKKNFGTMTKPLHAGLAARNGVIAALLAEEGFTAADGAMNDDGGFFELYSGDEPPTIGGQHVPGESWAIVEEGVDVKKYPCCYFTHAPIAAAQHITETNDLEPDDIERVTVHASRGAVQTLLYDDPNTGLEGKFSMEYSVAAAIARDRVGLAAFEDENIDDAAVQLVRERVRVETDPELAYSPYSATVDIETESGKTYSYTQERPPGTAMNPLSERELKAKFDAAIEHAPAAVSPERSYDVLTDLSSLEDVTELVDVLRPSDI